MLTSRIVKLNSFSEKSGPVIWWISRDQRAEDNWALLAAQETAIRNRVPLVAVFCLVPEFIGASTSQYSFMIDGLRELEGKLSGYGIPFVLLTGEPEKAIPDFAGKIDAGAVYTDFNPLRISQNWKKKIAAILEIAFYEVDTHNIVPCLVASPKQEFGAYTIRPKIKRLLPKYLTEIPKCRRVVLPVKFKANDWRSALGTVKADDSVKSVTWLKSGEKAAAAKLAEFIKNRLSSFSEKRNDPNLDGQSDLSPYLHFGQISAQRVALEVMKAEAPQIEKDAFIEELIVRKELSDNFCYYNKNYDSVEGFPAWSRKSLDEHRSDKREYLYSLKDFESGNTHDELWNASQIQMVNSGKMHGYMRMYWAKKILEWSESPESAMKTAIYLNDRYELDGRDPNGYAGIAWSIGGVHDRAWGARPVFGKVRFMSYNGCKSKFDIKKFTESIIFSTAKGPRQQVPRRFKNP